MQETIKHIVADVMEVPISSLNDDSSPDSIAAWDSLKHMNLVLALEQHFSITFSEEQIAEMMNLQLILLTVQALAAGH
ncbi:MAG: acyl carrier protein [Magnetococcales bacterium]|nr:acyl carrier protein [Magnetococcales bacterium]MBF0116195.1 acyl carrier protein [Magnetococcales bacterium]